jgi:hypothetical protein
MSFLVVCGTSHNSSRLESYGHEKLETLGLGNGPKFFLMGNVGRLIVVIDVNPSHGFWTARLIKVFGHEGKCTCIYNTHEWIVYIMLFPVVCGMSHGSSWLRRNEFLKMTK